MKDGNNFDFDDDFLNDENEPFDFDEEEGFPSGLGDEFDSDMPVMEEEQEERGTNRTFVFLAGIMIVLFVLALGVVLFLATRPTGPTDLELTASQVVLLNQTVEAQLAQTQTQNAVNLSLTQTAEAWTATPTETLTPTASNTPTATEFRPTVTPTPSQDLTAAAIAQLTADASNATQTPTPTQPGIDLDLNSAFSTQVAFATLQGGFDQQLFSTRVAVATQLADTSLNSEQEAALRDQLEGTRSAIDSGVDAVATAIAFIDNALNEGAGSNPALATALAEVIPAGIQTQAALGTPFAVATVNAVETQAALGTLSAGNIQSFPTGNPTLPAQPTATPVASGKQTEVEDSRGDIATQVAMVQVQLVQQDATAAIEATRDAFANDAIAATRALIGTQQAFATQQAFLTPPAYSTQAAVATQAGLATRQALINLALGIEASPTPGNGLEAVNQTATAIAGAFLTATAQAVTPDAITATIPAQQAGFPTLAVTALPDTGLFDDVVGGGSGGMGVLALAVFGLVGVIVVSRRLRSTNDRSDRQDAQQPPQN